MKRASWLQLFRAKNSENRSEPTTQLHWDARSHLPRRSLQGLTVDSASTHARRARRAWRACSILATSQGIPTTYMWNHVKNIVIWIRDNQRHRTYSIVSICPFYCCPSLACVSSDTRDRNEGNCLSSSLAEVSTCREVWRLLETLEDVLNFVERVLYRFIPNLRIRGITPLSCNNWHQLTSLNNIYMLHYVFWHGFIVSLRFIGLLHSRRISNAILQQRLLGTWHICLAPCDTSVEPGPFEIGAAGNDPPCRTNLWPDLTRPVLFDPRHSHLQDRPHGVLSQVTLRSFDPMRCHLWSEGSWLVVTRNTFSKDLRSIPYTYQGEFSSRISALRTNVQG